MMRRARLAMFFTVALVGCVPAGVGPSSVPASPAASQALHPMVVIGTDATIEIQVMAEVYAQAIEAAGFRVRRATAEESESLHDRLVDGSLDVVPALLAVELQLVGAAPTGDANVDEARLRRALAADRLTVLRPTSAEWTRGFGMRHEDASERGVTTVTQLAPIARELTWGLPDGCATLPGCGDVLAGAYGIDLADLAIEPIPACDAAAATALNDSEVDVALLCTTQPEIERFNLTILDDDQNAQPPGGIYPVVNDESLRVGGDRLSDALDEVSAQMTTPELTSLIARVTVDGESIIDVARSWLQDHSLA